MDKNSKFPLLPHQLIMQDRNRLDLTGVIDVGGFDDDVVSVSTSHGVLTIRGGELHVRQLSLESGNLTVEGRIESLSYSESQKSGLLGRLFR